MGGAGEARVGGGTAAALVVLVLVIGMVAFVAMPWTLSTFCAGVSE